MTAIEYKASAINLINSIDVNDSALLEKVWTTLSKMIPSIHRQNTKLSADQQAAIRNLDRLVGAFADSTVEDWKAEKEERLIKKYGGERSIQAQADCIVTSNIKDFPFAEIPVLSPEAFCRAHCV